MENKSILITGGTGSLGYALTKFILTNFKGIRKLVIYSRDEQKQFKMSQKYPVEKYPQIRYFIGDVRDEERLVRAFIDIDYVIHCAAIKHVPIAEYNPDECVKTNVNGAQNVISASLKTNVSKVVALSTDKACSPVNLYGATKLTSDKLFIAANNIKGNKDISFSVVRYGNVMGSNGSVIPFFKERVEKNLYIPITDNKMTRFNISIEEGVEMVLHALKNSFGGEIFVPKIPSYNIMDLAEAIAPGVEKKIIGIRPGEKIHEEMISENDSQNTFDGGKYYIITNGNKELIDNLKSKFKLVPVKTRFNYNSRDNDQKETIQSLKEKINKIL
jgi:UDP-N-acetylglucosamine 4,6-dehydratase